MRSIDSNFLAALTAAPEKGLIPRRFVWFKAKNRTTGVPETIGYWSGDEDISVTVTSGETGADVTRTYLGAGELLDVSDLPRTSDLTVQQVGIDLSQIAPAALAAVFEYDLRLAKVEIHEMVMDPATGLFAATPPCVFYGEVDSVPVTIPAVGGEGSMQINCVSDAISMLTRTNPALSSGAQQRRRSDDKFSNYASTVANWLIVWGEKG